MGIRKDRGNASLSYMDMTQVLDEYLLYKMARIKKESVGTLEHRLGGLITKHNGRYVEEFSVQDAIDCIITYAAGRVYDGQLPEKLSHKTVVSTVKDAQTWGKWMLSKRRGFWKFNRWQDEELREFVTDEYPVQQITGLKPQHTLDEARQLLEYLDGLVADNPRGIAAVPMVALILNLRVSEVLDITPRMLDDGGRVLQVKTSKTPTGLRRLEVPGGLQEVLARAAAGLSPTERLFPYSRTGCYEATLKYCGRAGVPRIGPHGLRRTHATIAELSGCTGEVVAHALGHTSKLTTRKHYTAAGVPESLEVAKVALKLSQRSR